MRRWQDRLVPGEFWGAWRPSLPCGHVGGSRASNAPPRRVSRTSPATASDQRMGCTSLALAASNVNPNLGRKQRHKKHLQCDNGLGDPARKLGPRVAPSHAFRRTMPLAATIIENGAGKNLLLFQAPDSPTIGATGILRRDACDSAIPGLKPWEGGSADGPLGATVGAGGAAVAQTSRRSMAPIFARIRARSARV